MRRARTRGPGGLDSKRRRRAPYTAVPRGTPMKLRSTPEGAIVEDPETQRSVSLPRAVAQADLGPGASLGEAARGEMLALLAGGAEARMEVQRLIEAAGDARVADPARPGLPFRPRSMRAFMLWESHYEGSARMLVKHFFPQPVERLAGASSASRAGPSRSFKPNERFHEAPAFYVGNHTAMLADGEEMWWPSHTSPRLRAGAGLRARQAAGRRDAGRGARGDRRLARPQRLERPRRAGRGGPTQRVRAGREVEDLRQLARPRRAHRRRAARLDGRTGPRAGRRRGLVRGDDRQPAPTTSARCSPTPPPASGSSRAT